MKKGTARMTPRPKKMRVGGFGTPPKTPKKQADGRKFESYDLASFKRGLTRPSLLGDDPRAADLAKYGIEVFHHATDEIGPWRVTIGGQHNLWVGWSTPEVAVQFATGLRDLLVQERASAIMTRKPTR